MLLKRLFGVMLPPDPAIRNAEVYRNIIRDFAREGGTVFGEIPQGVRREFFCLDENTWVWHEEWTGFDRKRRSRTTRYDIRPHGLFKAQDGQPYQPVSYEEALRLQAAAHQYEQIVARRLAGVTPVR